MLKFPKEGVLEVIEVPKIEKEKFDQFVKNSSASSFLQSWSWGDFQESLGRKVWRLAIEERGKFLATALVVKRDLPFSKYYLDLPQGPVLEDSLGEYQKILRLLIEELTKLSQREGAIFFRFELTVEEENKLAGELVSFLKKEGFFRLTKISPAHSQVQPPDTLVLDLTPSEEELLAAMRSSTRYAIRFSKRKGVEVEKSQKSFDFEKFLELSYETAKRNRFVDQPLSYYKKMFEVLVPQNFVQLFVAKFGGEIIATGWIAFFGKRGFYLRANSQTKYRNLQAPYLILWEAILEAKRRGYKEFDLWGIAPTDDPRHPWAGFSYFKKGFRGVPHHYIGVFDYPVDKSKYILSKGINFFRQLFKGRLGSRY